MLAVRTVSHTYGRRGRSLGGEGKAPVEGTFERKFGRWASLRVVLSCCSTFLTFQGFSAANGALIAVAERITGQQRRRSQR